MNKKPIIGLLLGDASGVGPEIIAKLAAKDFYSEYCRPVVLGDARILKMGADASNVRVNMEIIDSIDEATWTNGIPVLDQKNLDSKNVSYGKLTAENGKAVLESLKLATELYKENKIHGFCFAPLNKSAMKSAGLESESEHHYLAKLFEHTAPFGEINYVSNLWTTRTTSHIPIKEVSDALTINSISRAINLANDTLKAGGIENPRLGIAALNPHGGEDGKCGREEIDVIMPTIKKMQEEGINAQGPYPSDILFIKAFNGDFDGVVTMYHDQGQIALKLKGFDQGVTIAGGLPAPIVTCAHGTAFDIAGKGIVKTSAFENAVMIASKMAENMIN